MHHSTGLELTYKLTMAGHKIYASCFMVFKASVVHSLNQAQDIIEEHPLVHSYTKSTSSPYSSGQAYKKCGNCSDDNIDVIFVCTDRAGYSKFENLFFTTCYPPFGTKNGHSIFTTLE